ncbi:hypothetical protein ACFVVX_34910 [Kitasatospora sp. NPDC058170]|uniref:hypothetical protein n=1 Tax=Kitasatospora sp. NPDC058170 TaxID=3346364 RepID=UPI0036D89053
MTTNESRELAEQLIALADAPAPPAALDPAEALRRGRARLRRRRSAAIGAVAVVTAAVLAGTLLLQPAGGTATPPLPAAPSVTATGSPTPSPSPTAPAAPPAIDPLTTDVMFGWLPDWAGGRSGIGYETGYHGIFTQAIGKGEYAPRIILTLYPAGPEPAIEQGPGENRQKVEAPPVDGRPAFWLVDPDAHAEARPDRLLRWQAPSGRWAQIRAYGGERADLTDEVLLRVAADARYGKWDVPLPVRFAQLPEVFKATDVSLTRPSPLKNAPWYFWLMFQFEGKNVSVNLEPADTTPVASPTGTDGSPYTDPNPPVCRVENGVKACVGVGAGIAPSLEQIGGLEGLLARTTALGADESTWTTDVLRY